MLGFGLEMGPRPDRDVALRQRVKAKLLREIAREKEIFPLEKERIELFRKLVMAIYDALPDEERLAFVEDPLQFRSDTLLFRGLDRKKTLRMLVDGKMTPQAGQYASEAVFFCDNPFGAAQFMPPDGSLVVLDRASAAYMDPATSPRDISDPDLQRELDQYIASQPEERRSDAQYTAINQFDTEELFSANRNWKIVALRKEQPLASVSAVFVPDLETEIITTFDPAREKDLKKLRSAFGV